MHTLRDARRNSISELDFRQPLPEPADPSPSLELPSQLEEARQECALLRAQNRHLQSRLDEMQATSGYPIEVEGLRTQLLREREARQTAESELAVVTAARDALQQERHNWKSRMREAKAAYNELKVKLQRQQAKADAVAAAAAAERQQDVMNGEDLGTQPIVLTAGEHFVLPTAALRDVLPPLNENQMVPETVVDDVVVSPTQLSPEFIAHAKTHMAAMITQAPPHQPRSHVKRQREVEFEECTPRNRQEDLDDDTSDAPVAAAAVEVSAEKGKPAWKKAARFRQNDIGFDSDDLDLVGYSKAHRNDDDADEWDLRAAQHHQQHQQPPPLPQGTTTTTADGGSNHHNQQQQRPGSAGQGYRYQEVVRRRDERDRLPAFECEDCRRFYNALERWGNGTGTRLDMPVCGHQGADKGFKFGGLDVATRNALIANGSRHRYLHKPPSTPEGYWDITFSPEKAQQQQQREQQGERGNK